MSFVKLNKILWYFMSISAYLTIHYNCYMLFQLYSAQLSGATNIPQHTEAIRHHSFPVFLDREMETHSLTSLCCSLMTEQLLKNWLFIRL